MFTRISSLLALFLLTACFDGDGREFPEQEYLFVSTYSNMAWGFEYHGMYVDTDGNVYRFEPDDPGEAGMRLAQVRSDRAIYTAEEMRQVLTQNRSHVTMIDPGSFRDYRTLMGEAAEPTLESEPGCCFDYGFHKNMVFRYSRVHDHYEEVIILACGDTQINNETEAAQELNEIFAQASTVSWDCLVERDSQGA